MDQVCGPLEAADLSTASGTASTGSLLAATQQLVVCFALGPAGPDELWPRLRRATRRVAAVLLTSELAHLASRHGLPEADWPWAACEAEGRWTEQLVAGACAGSSTPLPVQRRLARLAEDLRRCLLLDVLKLARPLGRDGSAALLAEVGRTTRDAAGASPHATGAIAAGVGGTLQLWLEARGRHSDHNGSVRATDPRPALGHALSSTAPRQSTTLADLVAAFAAPGASGGAVRPGGCNEPSLGRTLDGAAAWDRVAASGRYGAVVAAAAAAEPSAGSQGPGAGEGAGARAGVITERQMARLVAEQLGMPQTVATVPMR